MTASGDVVVVGAGIVGAATACFLGQAGVKSLVIERDAVGSHASGFAYGGLSPLGGEGVPGPIAEIAQEGMRLHHELARALPEATGMDIAFRLRASLALAFTEAEARRLRAVLPWQQAQPGYAVRWVEPVEATRIEPRVSAGILGGVFIEGTADVEPYLLALALVRAAEGLGATIRHGRVAGLVRQGERVAGVVLERETIPCGSVVLAMGPWSGAASSWLGLPIEVRPLKGQILRLRAPGPPVACSVGWAGNYATTKPDGLLWTGTTEEDAGFDAEPTTEGRDRIIGSLLQMLPSMTEAAIVYHTACLRPLASDGNLLLGPVPGWEGAYMATGAGRKGILLGPAMARVTADLILNGKSSLALDAFDPGRFAR